MPLRDHFRPPVWTRSSWEGFHGMWPAMMVQKLVRFLPEEYTAEPRVHLGSYFEIGVCAYEDDEPRLPLLAEMISRPNLLKAQCPSPAVICCGGKWPSR
jgi:hypothetical protein